MTRRWILPLVLLAAALVVFVKYRHEQQRNSRTLEMNRKLVTEIRDLQQQNTTLQQTIEQMQQAAAASHMLHPTFVDQQKYYRQNWENYIHLKLNDYETGFLGGIKNAQVTLTNNTDYTLDRVTVQLQYFRANGASFKTETLVLTDIPAQKSKRVKAPDSRRGMSLKAHLTRMTSRTMNFCWQKDKKVAPGDDDPYRCAGSKEP